MHNLAFEGELPISVTGYVVDFYEVRSAQRTAFAKLGPVVAVCHLGGQRIDKNHRRDWPLCDAHLEDAH